MVVESSWIMLVSQPHDSSQQQQQQQQRLQLAKTFFFFFLNSFDIKELIRSYHLSGVKHFDREGEDSSADCVTPQYASKSLCMVRAF